MVIFLRKKTYLKGHTAEEVFRKPSMKKNHTCGIFLKRLLCYGIALFCSSNLPAAEQTPGPTLLSVGNAPGYPGFKVKVPFSVRRATNLVAAQFDLAYNTAKGDLGNPELAARHAGHFVRSREISPGVRRVLIYSLSNALLQTNGFNGTFEFEVANGERFGSGPITPGNVVLARADAAVIAPITGKGGTVFISPVYRCPFGRHAEG